MSEIWERVLPVSTAQFILGKAILSRSFRGVLLEKGGPALADFNLRPEQVRALAKLDEKTLEAMRLLIEKQLGPKALPIIPACW